MKFEQPIRLSKSELLAALASDDPDIVATALIGCALHEPDRLFAESLIVQGLCHDDARVRGISAIAAGHVARIHRELSRDRIVPLIEALLLDPRTYGKAQDALDDIRVFVR